MTCLPFKNGDQVRIRLGVQREHEGGDLHWSVRDSDAPDIKIGPAQPNGGWMVTTSPHLLARALTEKTPNYMMMSPPGWPASAAGDKWATTHPTLLRRTTIPRVDPRNR